jgi:hypothetical protein
VARSGDGYDMALTVAVERCGSTRRTSECPSRRTTSSGTSTFDGAHSSLELRASHALMPSYRLRAHTDTRVHRVLLQAASATGSAYLCPPPPPPPRRHRRPSRRHHRHHPLAADLRRHYPRAAAIATTLTAATTAVAAAAIATSPLIPPPPVLSPSPLPLSPSSSPPLSSCLRVSAA